MPKPIYPAVYYHLVYGIVFRQSIDIVGEERYISSNEPFGRLARPEIKFNEWQTTPEAKITAAREQRGLSLSEVADLRRAYHLYLESIENDDYPDIAVAVSLNNRLC